MDDITDRYIAVCNVKKIRQVDLQKAGGGSRPTVSAIFNKRQKPNLEIIEALIGLAPMLNVRWLFTGEGKMFTDEFHGSLNSTTAEVHLINEDHNEDQINLQSFMENFQTIMIDYKRLKKENVELKRKLKEF